MAVGARGGAVWGHGLHAQICGAFSGGGGGSENRERERKGERVREMNNKSSHHFIAIDKESKHQLFILLCHFLYRGEDLHDNPSYILFTTLGTSSMESTLKRRELCFTVGDCSRAGLLVGAGRGEAPDVVVEASVGVEQVLGVGRGGGGEAGRGGRLSGGGLLQAGRLLLQHKPSLCLSSRERVFFFLPETPKIM